MKRIADALLAMGLTEGLFTNNDLSLEGTKFIRISEINVNLDNFTERWFDVAKGGIYVKPGFTLTLDIIEFYINTTTIKFTVEDSRSNTLSKIAITHAIHTGRVWAMIGE